MDRGWKKGVGEARRAYTRTHVTCRVGIGPCRCRDRKVKKCGLKRLGTAVRSPGIRLWLCPPTTTYDDRWSVVDVGDDRPYSALTDNRTIALVRTSWHRTSRRSESDGSP